MDDYISHHGIKGQRWGIRRWQNPDGSLTPEGRIRYGRNLLKKSKTQNLDKFGKSENDNVLYITGYSGGGKSTLSDAIARKNDQIISLDSYQRPNTNSKFVSHYDNESNKIFDNYLDKKFPGLREKIRITKNPMDKFMVKDGKVVPNDDYAKDLSKFRSAVESFSREQYNNGNRCIVEGVQIKNGWFSQDISYYSDKPVIVVNTDQKESFKRSWIRDRELARNRGSELSPVLNADGFVKWYMNQYKQSFLNDKRRLDDFSKALTVEKGKKFC